MTRSHASSLQSIMIIYQYFVCIFCHTVVLYLAEKNEDRYLAAYAWRALAKLYHQLNFVTQAQTAQTRAIELFHELNLAHEANKL